MIPSLPLNNGTSIPLIGLGTSPLNDAQVAPVIVTAIEAGYRHIDTAVRYGNERGVGTGIRDSGIAREELFVTTKLDGEFQGDDRAIAGLDGSLERLGLDYVDLLLIHWPLPSRGEYVSTWHSFEKLLAAGKAKTIGVSNFKPAHIATLVAEAEVLPAVNQVQLSPYTPRLAERRADDEHGIATESWSPIGAGNDLLASPAIAAIAERVGKTAAQVVLRWHVQQSLVAIPKSSNARRIRENIDIFDFELTAADFDSIAALDRGPSAGVDSDHEGH
ncbi:MAG: 2,5-diketo-D-gluconic acid reductase [Microbacteriaceae bacterium]|jgi:2,5-diketo-D-gluconate reductase A|nr:2,5-diketo-D-gluconic acid reductase [Microbacteriaceae bacterium]